MNTPRDDYSWRCPRCDERFTEASDALKHSCQQDPTAWHEVHRGGGVTHEPDYLGSYYYGKRDDCRKCHALDG